MGCSESKDEANIEINIEKHLTQRLKDKVKKEDIDPINIVSFLTKDGGKWKGDQGIDTGFGKHTYTEYITFEALKNGVKNPAMPNIYWEQIYGVEYHTKLYSNKDISKPIHDECGYILFAFDDWLLNKNNKHIHVTKVVSIPRGMSMLAKGKFKYEKESNLIDITVKANKDDGILQTPFLNKLAITQNYQWQCQIHLENNTFRYKETTNILLDKIAKINHRDSNILGRELDL